MSGVGWLGKGMVLMGDRYLGVGIMWGELLDCFWKWKIRDICIDYNKSVIR